MYLLRTLAGTFAVLALLLGTAPSLTQDWFFAFIGGMRTHVVVVAVVLSLIYLALGRTYWHAVPLAAAIILAAYVGYLHLDLVQPRRQAEAGPTLKLIEFNMLGDNRNGAEIAAWLAGQKADVVYTLESRPISAYLSKLAETYPYRIGCGVMAQNCDLMIMSRYPLNDGRVRSIGPLRKDRFITATIEIGGQTLNLVAAHFTKPYFDSVQQDELKSARRRLKKIEGPIVLGGDFNSSLLSPSIRDFLRSSGLRSHGSEPHTWPTNLPAIGLPIDHILVRFPAHIDRLERMPDALGSNHFGLIAEISLPAAQ